MMRTYYYRLDPTKKCSQQPEHEAFQAHAKRLKRLLEHGTVTFAGSSDLPNDHADHFRMVIFEAENDPMAELFAEADPLVMEGLMKMRCLPFKPLE